MKPLIISPMLDVRMVDGQVQFYARANPNCAIGLSSLEEGEELIIRRNDASMLIAFVRSQSSAGDEA